MRTREMETFHNESNRSLRGLKDSKGNVILPAEYTRLNVTDEGCIVALKDDTYGVFSQDLSLLIPFGEYEYIYGKFGVFKVEKNDKKGIVGIDGKVIFPCEYDDIDFAHEFIVVGKKGKVGMYAVDGSEIIPMVYSKIWDNRIDENLLFVKKDGKIGLIKKDGSVFLPIEYDDLIERELLYNHFDGYIAEIKGKKGMILPDGKPLTDCIYDEIIVDENESVVVKDGKYYILRMADGKIINECPSDENGVYSPDGSTLLFFLTRNPKIEPNVKSCRTIQSRSAIDTIAFAEGHTELDNSWDYDIYDCIDHDPWLKKVFLPSSITKIDDEFFSQAYPKIIVPKGMMVYFKKIVPERFKDKVEEQE